MKIVSFAINGVRGVVSRWADCLRMKYVLNIANKGS